ncbi:Stk1 family PASTA domain-containing Ser/Thr kinase [Cohnella thailandensis]|uniref:Serine/threonine-protein kinase PrkC n=1 Tax=Cohnella thailandensis TaxID=557557 RepID=A0A841T2H2_9BACL|nr:Stk1 family PASTA domain-containing Ser/Thr kinase [Cohnella thailandensis]MBB6636568.1 Stk1 family PASTA domain-containing Ser/Thr kinase [Cohnella thailandensis]MBP1973558.1 serine/threonine-protein kinase [Cohnella thailandensis]
MIGHTLGGRYELLDRVGGGGMALVYKARDILLNRFVAVKVLRQQFMHDEDFVRRFRREAQAAASLSHPNIVSIYDVGQEDDTHYIIMEFIDGHNLNEIIRDRAPLQVEEAVRITAQIADALDHAHHNQIIHRDIKPHNILIGKNGRVKVTDFGIARAVTTSTITQTGSVLGSVHYFSPEHAKGISTGEKSDIYSLGIVLYQMLTGRLPFLGESPISVALKHLQESFERPKLVNPHIPQSVENIILRAMRKNPQERYQSAKQMLQDLETCLSPQRLHEPPVQFPSELLEEEDGEQTRVIPALKPDMRMSGEETIVKKEEKWDEEEEPKRRWVGPTVFGVIAVILIGILVWAIFALKGTLSPKDVDIPLVVDKPFAEAKAIMLEAGLNVVDPPPEEPSDEIEAGNVTRQDKQDMKVKEGATITLYVSSGPELSPMPTLTGKSYDDVVEELKALGVTEDRIEQETVNDESEAGTVLKQEPAAGANFDPDKDTIKLTVSEGLEEFPMPDLTGLTLDEAKAKLKENDLNLSNNNIFYEASYTATKDLVFKQFPAEKNEMVTAGTDVKIWIASGYPAEAKERPVDVTVPPTVEGQTSTVQILVTDARGEDIERKKEKIQSPTTYRITLVLAPNTSGSITVLRDGEKVYEVPVPYEDIPATIDPATEEPSNPPDGTDTGTPDGTEQGTGETDADNTQD